MMSKDTKYMHYTCLLTCNQYSSKHHSTFAPINHAFSHISANNDIFSYSEAIVALVNPCKTAVPSTLKIDQI